MKKYILCLLLVLPIQVSAVEIPRTEQEFIARAIKDRSIEANLPYKTILAIGWCESKLQPKAINFNQNQTSDVGIFQINSVHSPVLKQMGLSRFDYMDNINYTIYLVQKSGLSPWNSSKHCWNSKKIQEKVIALIDE